MYYLCGIMTKKEPYKIDVAVLLLFFNRPETFGKVFEQVREARPSKLLLYQDGPRGERDREGIDACRKIAENIDWDCEVYRKYQEKNYGCDPSEYIAQKWAFSIFDKCIVLEDDDVPSQSFFPFCKEMLDRYEHDERISMISGFNIDEETKDCPYDYFFTSAFSIWGWASWRRVVDKWDGKYSFLDDKYNFEQLKDIIKSRGYRNDLIKMCYDHRSTGKEYYESIFWVSMLLNSGLAIMPTKNQINNVGISGDSTHFSDLARLPKRMQRMFTMGRNELAFPLKHPPYVIDNVAYKERLYLVNAWNNPWRKIQYSLEELWNNLRCGDFKHIGKSLKRRINKWLGRDKHK